MVIWVDVTKPKRAPRKPGKRRFENIKVGDQLVRTTEVKGWRGGKDDFKGPPTPLSKTTWYYLVTDLWFDPVRGHDNRESGEMVAIQRIRETGEPWGGKQGHSIRGLASNGFQYADMDYVQFCRDRIESMIDGAVVGIGLGHKIRRRPKLPSARF